MADTTRTPELATTLEPIAFDERTRRVLELRKQVREGTYQPDPEEIARAMMREWFAAEAPVQLEAEIPLVGTAEERRAVAGRFVVEKAEQSPPDDRRVVLTA